jgi:retron-type reverse transcriptase
LIKRYYIEKKNGKLRPIGAPNLESKIMHRFLADMISNILEPSRVGQDSEGMVRGNHAYRKGLGAHTAIRDVVRLLKENIDAAVYEFDLKSFFNKVP